MKPPTNLDQFTKEFADNYEKRAGEIKKLLIQKGLGESAKDEELISRLYDKQPAALKEAVEDLVAVKKAQRKNAIFMQKMKEEEKKEGKYETLMPVDHVLLMNPQNLTASEEMLNRVLLHFAFKADGTNLLTEKNRRYRLPVHPRPEPRQGNKFIYRLEWNFLQDKLGEKDIGIIQQTIRSLGKKEFRFVYRDKLGKEHLLTNTFGNWLAAYKITEKALIYEYAGLFIQGIKEANEKYQFLIGAKNPPYSKLYPPHKFNLKGKYAFRLYKMLYYLKAKIENTKGFYEMDHDDFYFYMELEEQQKKWKYARRFILEPSIQELNAKTNISIETEYLYRGKFASELESLRGMKCTGIAFAVHFNDQQ